jgi:predicted RNA binding protein YcfA (HicA-like mRNA interferase family)
LVRLLAALGLQEKGGRGSHRVFTRKDIQEIVNLQAEKSDAKLIRVRQIANLIRRYNLMLTEE